MTPDQIAKTSEHSEFKIIQPVVISRKRAIELGLKYYYTGKACKNGHVDSRFVSSTVCRSCGRIQSREYGRANIKKIINNFKKRTYGVVDEDIERMRIEQNNKCGICKINFEFVGTPHLDHCHKTGKIRKLLCSKCNTGLGLFNDDVELLKLAIEYLKNAP